MFDRKLFAIIICLINIIIIFLNRIIEKNINAGRFLPKFDDRPRVAPGPSSSLARSGGQENEALVKRYFDAVHLSNIMLRITSPVYSEHKEYEYSYYDANDDPEAGCEGDDCGYDYYYYDDDDVHDDGQGHDDYQDYEYYEETGDDSDKENNADYYYTTKEKI